MAITAKSDRKTLHRGQDRQQSTSARTSTGRADQTNTSTGSRSSRSNQKSLSESQKLGSSTQEQTSQSNDQTVALTPAHETVSIQAPTTTSRRVMMHHGARVTITLKLNLGTGAPQR